MRCILSILFGVGVIALWSVAIGYGYAQAAGKPQSGYASWYSTRECHAPTASGEALRDDAYTCASWFYPFGTRLRVSTAERSVIVRVNDRGPTRRLVAQGRVIDLTRAAFSRLAPLSRGVIAVTVEEVR